MVHELITYFTGFNTYILYLVGPPALLGVLLTGGLRRTFRLRIAYLWIAFSVWLILDIPFSSWPGGSANTVSGFVRLQLPVLFVLAGLPMTWKECRTMITAITLAGIISVAMGRLFVNHDSEGRASLAFGTISNANDFAAHLLLLIPFILLFVMSPSRSRFLRFVFFLPIPYGMYVILSTASRGALVALSVGFLFVLWRATPKVRLMALVGMPVAAVAIFLMLPQAIVDRLQTFSASSNQTEDSAKEAAESADSRIYLFTTSLKFAVEHPIFGVGPGQFSSFEGKTSQQAGLHGVWQSTHSIFTQIASECGLPAFIFFIGAIGGTLATLFRVQTLAARYQFHEISRAAFCILLGMVMFLAAAAFLNLAYMFYLPALGGLAIAMYSATQDEIANLGTKAPSTAGLSRAPLSFSKARSFRPAGVI
jgi:O-antigen ligase